MSILKPLGAVLLAAFTTSSTVAADNPMWRSGLAWECAYTQMAICERQTVCTTKTTQGTIKIQYADNKVLSVDGIPVPIRRHYGPKNLDRR